MPELRLALLAGAAGLGRDVRRVYPTELSDRSDLFDPRSPQGPTDGDVLVLGERPAREDVDWVDSVRASGVVALVGRDVPQDLVRACGRVGLPLFVAPDAVPPGRLVDLVAARVAGGHRVGVEQLLRRQRRLVVALAEGADTRDLVDLLARELGAACRVLTPTGRVLAAAGPSVGPPPDGAEVARVAAVAERLPVMVGGHTVFALGRRATTAGYLVCAGEWAHDSVVAQTAEVLALGGVRRTERLSVERSHAWALVDLVESGAAPGTVRARLAAAGIDAAATPTVCCATIGGAGDASAVVGRLVVDLLEYAVEGDPAARWVSAQSKDELVVFAAAGTAGEARVVAALRAAARWWEPVLGPERVAVGVSGGSPTWATALAEARGARDLAWTRPGRLTVAAGHEIDSYPALLAGLPAPVRAAFAARVLGRLHAHDAEHDGDLIGTLAAFLAANGAWQRCAAALGVQVSTLHQRMGRVRDLTGRDLFSARDRVDLLLALESVGAQER